MVHMTEAEFQDAVDDALDSLPLDIIEEVAASNTVILTRDEPDDSEAEILGVFEGVPLTERGHHGLIEPGRIIIFRGPLERMARDRAHLIEEIRVTVLHEIGHLFGIEEDRLHELGWG